MKTPTRHIHAAHIGGATPWLSTEVMGEVVAERPAPRDARPCFDETFMRAAGLRSSRGWPAASAAEPREHRRMMRTERGSPRHRLRQGDHPAQPVRPSVACRGITCLSHVPGPSGQCACASNVNPPSSESERSGHEPKHALDSTRARYLVLHVALHKGTNPYPRSGGWVLDLPSGSLGR